MFSRRDFLQSLALMTSGLLVAPNCAGTSPAASTDRWGKVLPKRKLGKSGAEVTMLGVGGYHVGWTTEKEAQEVIETAMEQGIRFFDSAYSYGQDGMSEKRYGRYLIPKYRDQVFIMSKSTATDYAGARRELEESLRRYGVDTLDLWQTHALSSPVDTDARINNGVLRLIEDAKKEGKITYAGFTGHANPYAHARMLEQASSSGLFTTVQMPINPVDAAAEHSFIRTVLARAVDLGLGVLAMKTLADGRFFKEKKVLGEQVWQTDDPIVPDETSLRDVIHFAWSMPISTLITGAENTAYLTEKVAFAHNFTAMSADQRTQLVERMTAFAEKGQVEYYKTV